MKKKDFSKVVELQQLLDNAEKNYGPEIEFFEHKKSGTELIFDQIGSVLYITIAGSNPWSPKLSYIVKEWIKDWWINLCFWRGKYETSSLKMKGHAGILYKTKSIISTIENKIITVNPSRVVISGHSHGGAVAEQIYIILRSLVFPHREMQVITFGANPSIREYNSDYKNLIKNQAKRDVWNLKAQGDIVPTLKFGNQNIGQEIISKSKKADTFKENLNRHLLGTYIDYSDFF